MTKRRRISKRASRTLSRQFHSSLGYKWAVIGLSMAKASIDFGNIATKAVAALSEAFRIPSKWFVNLPLDVPDRNGDMISPDVQIGSSADLHFERHEDHLFNTIYGDTDHNE